MVRPEKNEFLQQAVRDAIDQLGYAQLNRIMVNATDSDVEISGTVHSQQIKKQVHTAALGVDGVNQVRNNLSVDSVH